MTSAAKTVENVKVYTAEGTPFTVSYDLVRWSPFLKDIVDMNPGSDEAIPLPGIMEREFALVVKFLQQFNAAPFCKINRPVSVNNCKGELEVLKSFADLNVPDWAVDFMASMPFSANIVMLGEAASALGIVMLEAVAATYVAYKLTELMRDKGLIDLAGLGEFPTKHAYYKYDKKLQEANRWLREEELPPWQLAEEQQSIYKEVTGFDVVGEPAVASAADAAAGTSAK